MAFHLRFLLICVLFYFILFSQVAGKQSCLNLLSSDFFSATSAQLRTGSGGRGGRGGRGGHGGRGSRGLLLPAACCLLPAACCLPPAACRLLPALTPPPRARRQEWLCCMLDGLHEELNRVRRWPKCAHLLLAMP